MPTVPHPPQEIYQNLAHMLYKPDLFLLPFGMSCYSLSYIILQHRIEQNEFIKYILN